MIAWDQHMFTTTQYLFGISTTWQYMVFAAVVIFIVWLIVSIIENFLNERLVPIVEKYLFRPVLFIGTSIIAVGALYYMIIVLKDYIWGVG